MIVGVLVCAAVGILCLVLGSLIWKKQKLSYIHEYHHRNVKPEDVPAYTRLVGMGLIVIGAGTLLTGVLNSLLRSGIGWIAFYLALLIGILLLHKAQKTYNGSWFS